jgi:hypothetical protein
MELIYPVIACVNFTSLRRIRERNLGAAARVRVDRRRGPSMSETPNLPGHSEELGGRRPPGRTMRARNAFTLSDVSPPSSTQAALRRRGSLAVTMA